jgi:hypothetical protein
MPYFSALSLNSSGQTEEDQLPITSEKVFRNPSEFQALHTALLIGAFRTETPNVTP